MATLDRRTKANLDIALEEACRGLPHGGNHEVRQRVAQALLQATRCGNTTLDGLSTVARNALSEVIEQQKSA